MHHRIRLSAILQCDSTCMRRHPCGPKQKPCFGVHCADSACDMCMVESQATPSAFTTLPLIIQTTSYLPLATAPNATLAYH